MTVLRVCPTNFIRRSGGETYNLLRHYTMDSSDIASSESSTPSQLNITFDFWSVFRITYPEKDRLPLSRGRKNGPRYYNCLLCDSWSNKYKGNAIIHTKSIHPDHIRDNEVRRPSQSLQLSIESFIDRRTLDIGLRNTFNRQ